MQLNTLFQHDIEMEETAANCFRAQALTQVGRAWIADRFDTDADSLGDLNIEDYEWLLDGAAEAGVDVVDVTGC